MLAAREHLDVFLKRVQDEGGERDRPASGSALRVGLEADGAADLDGGTDHGDGSLLKVSIVEAQPVRFTPSQAVSGPISVFTQGETTTRLVEIRDTA